MHVPMVYLLEGVKWFPTNDAYILGKIWRNTLKKIIIWKLHHHFKFLEKYIYVYMNLPSCPILILYFSIPNLFFKKIV